MIFQQQLGRMCIYRAHHWIGTVTWSILINCLRHPEAWGFVQHRASHRSLTLLVIFTKIPSRYAAYITNSDIAIAILWTEIEFGLGHVTCKLENFKCNSKSEVPVQVVQLQQRWAESFLPSFLCPPFISSCPSEEEEQWDQINESTCSIWHIHPDLDAQQCCHSHLPAADG